MLVRREARQPIRDRVGEEVHAPVGSSTRSTDAYRALIAGKQKGTLYLPFLFAVTANGNALIIEKNQR